MGLLDASATMNAYDSIERTAPDGCEPLRGRRPRTFTLTQLLVACGAVCVCAIVATTVVNTHADYLAQLGGRRFRWGSDRLGPAGQLTKCKDQEAALTKDLMSCNSDLKSKINERLAELGEPVRNGRVLLGGYDHSCTIAMKEKQDLLAECKAELVVHNDNAELKAEIEKLKAENVKLKASHEHDADKFPTGEWREHDGSEPVHGS